MERLIASLCFLSAAFGGAALGTSHGTATAAQRGSATPGGIVTICGGHAPRSSSLSLPVGCGVPPSL